MSIALGAPTLVSDVARENSVLAYNASLTASPVAPNPILRIRGGSTTLVDLPLHATTPFAGAAVDGSASFNFLSLHAMATGGSQTTPDNYQLLGRDGAVHLSGLANATVTITAGQTVSASTITAIVPAS